ncbi:MAG: hypothetical protein HY364_02505 [Candidatus Aenigmarchaeota archaeon]|nr:hypothetical protein [Candidatus Aenigmarchaeota archaeon]
MMVAVPEFQPGLVITPHLRAAVNQEGYVASKDSDDPHYGNFGGTPWISPGSPLNRPQLKIIWPYFLDPFDPAKGPHAPGHMTVLHEAAPYKHHGMPHPNPYNPYGDSPYGGYPSYYPYAGYPYGGYPYGYTPYAGAGPSRTYPYGGQPGTPSPAPSASGVIVPPLPDLDSLKAVVGGLKRAIGVY